MLSPIQGVPLSRLWRNVRALETSRPRIVLVFLLLIALPPWAQQPANLPKTLPELAAVLPELVHAQQKPFDFGPFSEAMTIALQRDPASAYDAIPVLSKDLQDADPEVQRYTIAVLYGMTMRQDASELLAPVFAQLADAITSANQYTQSMALLTVASLKTKAPDIVVSPTRKLLQARSSSDRVTLAAAGALVAMRPTDETIQTEVLSAINDPKVSEQLRVQLVDGTAEWGVGPLIVNNVVRLVNTSEDKQMRDAAISGATKIGPNALSRVVDRLQQIKDNPTESAQSHQLADQALSRLAIQR